MINHIQARMCRAALRMSTHEVGAEVGISHASVANYEKGSDKVGLRVERRLDGYYRSRGAFFGPASSVSWDQDVFAQDRWLTSALFQMLKEHGGTPNSTDLIEAAKRADANDHGSSHS